MNATLARVLLAALLLVLVLLLGLVLAPAVHGLLVDLGWIGEDKFTKVLRRLLLIPVLVVLFAMLRPWRDGGPAAYGLTGPRARPRTGLAAFGVTALLLVGLLAWQMAEGWLFFENPLRWGEFFRRVSWWIVAALFLGVLEEWFFRGWMSKRLEAVAPRGLAVLLVAFVFAALHAFKASRLDIEVTHDVRGAFEALGWWLGHLVDVEAFGPTFVGLFLLSLLLSAAYRRTGSLWTAVGIHAAGIWVLRTYGALTYRHPPRTWAGSKELYDGWPAWLLLAIVLCLLLRPAREGGSRRDAP